MNRYVGAAIAGEVLLLIALAVLILTGLVPPSDIAYAIAGALVTAAFTIPTWAFRNRGDTESKNGKLDPQRIGTSNTPDADVELPDLKTPREEEVIAEETIVLKRGNHQEYTFKLSSKGRIEGKVSSSSPIDVWIMTEGDFGKFVKKRGYYYEEWRRSVREYPVRFRPPQTGHVVCGFGEQTNERQ